MDVAASIAGLLSLGIQVTQSLVDYYAAYKGREADVAHTSKKLDRLLGMLENLRLHLADRKSHPDEKDVLNAIEGTMQDCEVFLHKLQSQCEKFKDNSTSGIRAKARTPALKLAYPFRRSTLAALDETVDEVASHLALALQMLQQKSTDRVQDNTEEIKSLLELVRADQISQGIRSWLQAPDAAVNYNEACKKRHDGTGLWLVYGPVFSSWRTKPNSFLWLNGFAGCGKSVLCSTAVQYVFRHRRSNPRIGIAFFFFTFSDDGKQDTSAMLRTLVLQLSGQLNDSYGLLSRLYNDNRNAPPHDDALIGCLHQLVRAFDDTYIVLDALDESPRDTHRRGMLQALADLRAWSEPGLHLLVTSRDEPDIRNVLVDELGALHDEMISMNNDSVDRDIASFIVDSFKNDRRLRKWETYRDQIEASLTERAKGVFRWVECQFTALGSCPKSKRRLDTLLASLPQSLDETYERMLLNIGKESIKDARRILTILCCAKRPLTVPEIIEGIAIELGDDPHLDIEARLSDEDDIYEICPGLIEINCLRGSEVPTVRIAHFSVQEYLESERIRQHPVAIFGVRKSEAHAEMACICLTYLLALGSPMSGSEYPLTHYAAKCWPQHYHEGDQDLYRVQNQVTRLFRSARGEFENWARVWDTHAYGGALGEWPTRIYYASLFGLDSVVSDLLDEKPSAGRFSGHISDVINIRGGFRGNALQAAALGGHEKIVQLLLDKGANVNAQGGYNGCALQAASTQGSEKIIQLLLDKGANIDAQDGPLGNALQVASSRGDENIVQLLLDKGADINVIGGDYRNALRAASMRGHENIVQLLLEKGANINAQGRDGNALEAASWEGYEKIIQLLLDKGADINAQGTTFVNALQAASSTGIETIVRLLLDKGADINAWNIRDGNALQTASINGHETIVRLLLDRGADVNAQGGEDGNALQVALANGHKTIVRLLLDKGADVNAKGGDYGNALHAASRGGNEKIVQLLLDKGADINARSGLYRSALQAASAGGHEKAVQLLLDKGADINAQGGHYGSALQAALGEGHETIVRLLLSKGAFINA